MISVEDTTQVGANDANPLIGFLTQIDLAREIVNLLHPSVRNITALAFTCKQAGQYVDRIMVSALPLTSSTYIQISLMFISLNSATMEEKSRELVYGATFWSSHQPPPSPRVARHISMISEGLFILVMVSIPQSFRHVVLDRLPFLDVNMVGLVISSMPNLESLAISRCDLLDVAKLPALIKIIKEHPRTPRNKGKAKALRTSNAVEGENVGENGGQNSNGNSSADDSSSTEDEDQTSSNDTSLLTEPDTGLISTGTAATSVGDEDQTGIDVTAATTDAEGNAPIHYIRLDFSPFFFRGPNTCERLGSFGVTYNEPTFHTPKAVVALMMQCWDDADTIGMDLMSDSSSFFSFVRRLPGWNCLWSLKARDAMLSFKRETSDIVLPEDFQRTVERTARSEIIAENHGSSRVSQPAFLDQVIARVVKLRKGKHDEIKKEAQNRFYDDLMAATSGDDFRPSDYPLPNSIAFYLGNAENHNAFGYWRRQYLCQGCKKLLPRVLFAIELDDCWGCKMVAFVRDMESSDLRRWKQSAIGYYLKGLDIKKGSLTDVIDPARGRHLTAALGAAKIADSIWLKFMNFSPTDLMVYPPEPPNLHRNTAAYSRYRWKHNWPEQAFDYREGGPQHEDPFKHPNSAWEDTELCGGEPPESFNTNFRWSEEASTTLFEEYIRRNGLAKQITDPEAQKRIAAAKEWEKIRRLPGPKDYSKNGMWHLGRDLRRYYQNQGDKSIHALIHGRVEKCIWSFNTPMLRPFDLDHPIPDKRVDYEAWEELKEREIWELVPAGHSRRWL
ncbi:hypothetical protein QC763_102020 [Podospora pseudopauciseta]|uniref:F-box domain-containing protein n=1 Tax=Podospora pseudopauciseta TaxID=2093780 RepID=A0ABR0HWG1_9PEZI|nr:hypothetical protein QC763_102020 [Podospora pseudopauciseta]